MDSCYKCNYTNEDIRDIHRLIDKIEWSDIKSKLHIITNIQGSDIVSLKQLLLDIESITEQYSTHTKQKCCEISDKEADGLLAEYINIKHSTEDIDRLRKDEIINIFEENNIEIVEDGGKIWYTRLE